MGFTPIPGQGQPEGKFVARNGRIIMAILVIVALAMLWWFFSSNEHTELAGLTQTAGELLAGGLVGVLLAEREAARTINIYINGKNSSDQTLVETQEALRVARAELSETREATPGQRENGKPYGA